MSRLAATLTMASFAALAFTAPALAAGGHDNGEGLLGETNDRIITFFSLGVVLFFFTVVCLGSFIQGRLEKRKEARKASELRQRIGW
jgi:hypothetical protein